MQPRLQPYLLFALCLHNNIITTFNMMPQITSNRATWNSNLQNECKQKHDKLEAYHLQLAKTNRNFSHEHSHCWWKWLNGSNSAVLASLKHIIGRGLWTNKWNEIYRTVFNGYWMKIQLEFCLGKQNLEVQKIWYSRQETSARFALTLQMTY